VELLFMLKEIHALILVWALIAQPVAALAQEPQKVAESSGLSFHLAFASEALSEPFTGRVFVVLTRTEPRPLVRNLDWFNPQPTFAVDVQGWKPGEPLVVGAGALAFPTPLAELPPRPYYVQAILDRDLGGISVFSSPGNVYSKPQRIEFDPKHPKQVELLLDQLAEPRPFRETDRVKLVEIPSPLLTDFHRRPIRLRAGVLLPKSFAAEPQRTYPVVYEITGFGGDHSMAQGLPPTRTDLAGTEAIWVVVDANCRLGHHVFADSANNGPCGRALVEELIPHIERTFRGRGRTSQRLVTGHSSGGWSSLWLQVTYPDTFGGCWSTSPDPVDFRDFQRVDLYASGSNLFTTADGKLRELSRGSRPLTFRSFSAMEDVMGRGGQLGSFEAVFSPRGADGRPQQLWDRKTGVIDPTVARSWEAYDINLVLERKWSTLGPKLAGKVHVWMGEADTFYLEGATRKLKVTLQKLGSDAVVELFPGKTHNLMDSALRRRMSEEMSAALAKRL
jgi:S-formylglutathione hydrolase FrmB